MKMNKAVVAIMFVTMLVAGVGNVSAAKLAEKLSNQTMTVSIEIKACQGDAAKLCPGLPTNSRKFLLCMMAYEDNLSTACKMGIGEVAMALETGLKAIEYSIVACEADADRFCLDVEPGNGKIVGCLRENESKLETQCVTALKKTGFWNLGVK